MFVDNTTTIETVTSACFAIAETVMASHVPM